jgi:tetratricopeptide (TPR) repeat protein
MMMNSRPLRFGILFCAAVVLAGLWGCGPRTRKPVEGEKVLAHVVSPGETFEVIADDYYGDPDRAGEIRDFNLLDSDELHEGDVVRVYMTPDDMDALGKRKRARVPYNAGLDMVSRGAWLDAIAEFQEAIALDPGFAEAEYNLGVTYQKMDAHDKAIEQLERALELRPGDADYHYALGNSYYHTKRYDPAIRSFDRALSINPAFLKAQYSLAVSLEKAGNTSRARREWRRYLDMDGDSEWADRARERLAELEQ